MQTRSDVLIIGGGAIGMATALELALRGVSVAILSRNSQEAALHAAAGMLAPQAEGLLPGPMLELCLRSRSLYPEWIDKLESLTGMNSEYWPCGIIAPLYRDAELLRGTEEAAQWCDRPSLDILQPELSDEVAGGWWFPEDGQVDNQAMARALRAAVAQCGIAVREGVAVDRVARDGNKVTGVCAGNEWYRADCYLLAAGAWSGELLPIPVVPRKGQLLAVRSKTGRQPLQHVLFGSEVYLVPRHNGRIVVGATSEDVGFTPHNTPAGVQQLLTAAIRLYPLLEDWILEQYWWGFRPATPDELPILGASPYSNLVLATGHYRNGILLTPITAALLADLICQQRIDPILNAFRYSRFTEA
ncbi:glycine oxidase ThiO [Altericista sp. CCNU0014]|uniref:glycine oxidase ThiO n=1 Tax=Altericista sp. CCNU0014 TaxID=3082949 RepID=UPI003850A82D